MYRAAPSSSSEHHRQCIVPIHVAVRHFHVDLLVQACVIRAAAAAASSPEQQLLAIISASLQGTHPPPARPRRRACGRRRCAGRPARAPCPRCGPPGLLFGGKQAPAVSTQPATVACCEANWNQKLISDVRPCTLPPPAGILRTECCSGKPLQHCASHLLELALDLLHWVKHDAGLYLALLLALFVSGAGRRDTTGCWRRLAQELPPSGLQRRTRLLGAQQSAAVWHPVQFCLCRLRWGGLLWRGQLCLQCHNE